MNSMIGCSSVVRIAMVDSGLQDATKFDRVEIEPMIEDGEGGLVPAFDDLTSSVCAYSVRLHLKEGGVDTAFDFMFDPSEPEAGVKALKFAEQYAQSLGDILMVVNSGEDLRKNVSPNGGNIDGLISIWSMRPQPNTPIGDAWEAGAKWGWEQANRRYNDSV